MSAPPDFELPQVAMPFEVQPLDPPPPTPEEIEAELRAQRKEENENADELASAIVTLIPIVGEVKGLIEVFTGGDLISGHHQAWWQKALNVVACLPVIHEATGVVKVISAVGHMAHRVNIVVHASHLKHPLDKIVWDHDQKAH
jgi:hypothetical protein